MMFRRENVRTAIDSLNANVAVLNHGFDAVQMGN